MVDCRAEEVPTATAKEGTSTILGCSLYGTLVRRLKEYDSHVLQQDSPISPW